MSKRVIQIYSGNPFSTAVPRSSESIFEWEQKDTSGNIRTYRKFSDGSTAVVPQGGGTGGDLSEYYKSTQVDALLLQKADTSSVAQLDTMVDALSDDVTSLGTNVTALGNSISTLSNYALRGVTVSFSTGKNNASVTASTASNIVNIDVSFPKCTATGGGSTITVDTAVNATSTNPVENKAIFAELQTLQTSINSIQTSVNAQISTMSTLFSSAVASKQDAPTASGSAGQVLGLDSSLRPVWVNQSTGGGTGTGGGGGMSEDQVTAIAMEQALIFG